MPEILDRDLMRCTLPDGREVACINYNETLTLWNEISGDSPYVTAVRDLQPDEVIVDVGGHIGLASMCFADNVPGARILTFEPAPAPYGCLEDNLARHVPHGTAFQLAVGAEQGSHEFTYYPLSSSTSTLHVDEADSDRNLEAFLTNMHMPDVVKGFLRESFAVSERLIVETTTLASVFEQHAVERVGLLKIDAERGELDVIRGIDDGYWPRIRRALIEVHDIGGRLGEIAGRLATLGYQVGVSQAPAFAGGSVYTVLATRG
jgi:FkbM family methyltransferase